MRRNVRILVGRMEGSKYRSLERSESRKEGV